MTNLENIMDITSAIRAQKRHKEPTPKIVEDLLNQEKSFLDLSARLKVEKKNNKVFPPNLDEELFEKEGLVMYNPLKLFSEYISAIKDKLYDYYSSAKKSIKKVIKSEGYKILTEIEDWGVIFFKPTFLKLIRLTPMGFMARYQQKLWLYVGKTVK